MVGTIVGRMAISHDDVAIVVVDIRLCFVQICPTPGSIFEVVAVVGTVGRAMLFAAVSITVVATAVSTRSHFAVVLIAVSISIMTIRGMRVAMVLTAIVITRVISVMIAFFHLSEVSNAASIRVLPTIVGLL